MDGALPSGGGGRKKKRSGSGAGAAGSLPPIVDVREEAPAQSLPRPIPLEAPEEAQAEPETEEGAAPEPAEVTQAATVVVAGPDTPPKSPGAEPSLASATDVEPSIRAPSSERLSVDDEGTLMSEKSLLDPAAGPPAPPSEFPVTLALLDVVRQSHVLAGAIVGVCCGTLYSLRKLSSGLRR